MAKQGLPEGKAASSADEPLGETLAELWGLPPGSGAFHREQAAERQLLSFAAAATLGPQIRAHALTCTSATGRLSAALCALRQQERRLAAILTLRNSGLRAD
mmetsp:Transcript_25798/g.76809  ORF Transcript_25798/g.76809 Transcript_25798/m.76809 type:complete len:102 (+) Transcript_25798:3-308(+)